MVSHSKERIVLRELLAVFLLLGCPRLGATDGIWSVVAPQGTGLGQVNRPRALAVDPGGSFYVADLPSGPEYTARIQKPDFHGAWSLLDDQVDNLSSLAADEAGNLYLASGSLQMRDSRGNWSLLGPSSSDPGSLTNPSALGIDVAGNLYVVDYARILKRDVQGAWSVIALAGAELGQVNVPTALAVDPVGNLYVADGFSGSDRIQKRDTQGHWSVIASAGRDLGQVHSLTALAADGVGNLYAAEGIYDVLGLHVVRIQRRDSQRNWSEVAREGDALGQVHAVASMAVDPSGNLYVADTGNNRVQVYTPVSTP